MHSPRRTATRSPRLSPLAGGLVLVLGMLLAASAVAELSAAPSPEASGAVAQQEAAQGGAAPGDSLVQAIAHTSARVVNGTRVYRLTLKPGTSQATANRLADFVAEGGDPGSLTIFGDGFRVERSTIRLGTVPLPPPPPPAKRASDTRRSGLDLPPPPPRPRGSKN